MKTCFVIQPFDNGKFDKRYEDVFVPAIIDSGLQPYRIDKDPGTSILIDDIENAIKNAAIVLADVTLDNPNVWYELGYAFSCNKQVVIVCCQEERNGNFPFDIRHRSIIQYRVGSKSDFTDLEDKIKAKMKSYISKSQTVEVIHNTPIKALDGLKAHEIAILFILMEKLDSVSVYQLKQFMDSAGYTAIATGVGIATLAKSGFIKKGIEIDHFSNGEEYPICSLTEKGEEWIIENQHLVQFEKKSIEKEETPKETKTQHKVN